MVGAWPRGRGGGGKKWADSGNIMEVEQTGLADALEVGGGRKRGIRDIILAYGGTIS